MFKNLVIATAFIMSAVALCLTISLKQQMNKAFQDVDADLGSVNVDIDSIEESLSPVKNEICSDRSRLDKIEDLLDTNLFNFQQNKGHIRCIGDRSFD